MHRMPLLSSTSTRAHSARLHAARSLVTLGAEGIARFEVATKAREFVGAQGRDAGFRVLTVRDVDGDGRSEIVEQHAAKTTLRDPALQLLAEVMTPDGTLSSFLLPLSATHGDSLLYLRAGEAPMLAKPGKGKDFEQGKLSLEDLRAYAVEKGEPKAVSGQQELIENIINRYI